MATCFGVFIYAIIRPADVEVNIMRLQRALLLAVYYR
jgi:hypothetical protein